MELRQMGINFGINTLRATIGITGFGFRTARIIGNQLLYPVTSLVDRATIMATRDDTPNLPIPNAVGNISPYSTLDEAFAGIGSKA